MKAIFLKFTPLILCLLGITDPSNPSSKKVNIIYIGDSITYGAGLSDPSKEAPPAIADSDLAKMNIDVVASSNQGHGGFTTTNFLPNTPAFKQLEDAADKCKGNGATMLFSLMLGTNDSAIEGPLGAPLSKEKFYENLKAIIDQLLKDYPGSIVIVHRQTWYSPNTYNGARYLQEGLNRLESYYPEMKRLIQGYKETKAGKVYLGDTKAFDYFKDNYLTSFQAENGHEGVFYLHPNKAGAAALGMFWSKAIYNAINGN